MLLSTRIFTIPLIGVLVILGACNFPAVTAPVAGVSITTPAVTIPLPTPESGQAGSNDNRSILQVNPAPVQDSFSVVEPRYVIQVTPVSTQAYFRLSQLQASPEEVELGDNATFSVVVTNTGEQRNTYTVRLKLDDATKVTQDVTIDGGDSKTVELNAITEKFGVFKVKADNLTTWFRAWL